MPLISDRDAKNKVVMETEIIDEVEMEIKAYCKWAGISDFGYFLEEAAKIMMEAAPIKPVSVTPASVF